MRQVLILLIAAQLSAADIPTKFASAGPDARTSNEAELQQWWRSLHDDELNSLIDRCIASNLDVRLAAQRVLEARAARRISRADLFPTVESNDSVQRIRGGFNQGIIHTSGKSPGLISAFETNAYQLGFDASWEIDFFGGKRKALEAATAEVRANEEARRDVLVSLLAETARNYIELRGAQRQLKLTRDNIALQQDSLHLTEVRADAGLGNRLDLERQRTQLQSTQAIVPQIELRIAQEIHALGVLLALPPAALQAELEAAAPLPPTPPEVPAGLPSDLLKRRPDIREADAENAASAARIGVARADFFPKITLTGSAGRQSADWSGFTLGAGNFFTIGPGVKIPLFTGGRLKANLAVQKQRYEESLTTYQSIVLRSLRETEDSLEAYNRERERAGRLTEAVRSSELSAQLARDVYTGGLADFLSVLDAQRQQLQAETDLAVSDTAALTNLIALYKALGGGWSR
jgi:NodT family efflux transporter outer membrane factor (OMF) lipoprotein